MTFFRAAVLGMALTLCGASANAAAPPMPQVDRSGKGAVLCVWMLTTMVRETSRRCDIADRSAEFDRELDDAIRRIEAFIKLNATNPPKNMSKARKAMIADQTVGWDFCRGAPELYSALKQQGVAAHHAGIDDVLSVPREPLMNPCL